MDSRFSALTGYVSREQRIKNVLQTSPWVFFEDYQDISKAPSPMQDTVDILAIVVTTLMLLAVNYGEISSNHLRWTYSYLSCIKDENGRTPPNIKGIMNHIKMTNKSIESFIEGDTISSVDEVEERNVEAKEGSPAATADQSGPSPSAPPAETPSVPPEETPSAPPEETPSAPPEETPTAPPEEVPSATPEEAPAATPEDAPGEAPAAEEGGA